MSHWIPNRPTARRNRGQHALRLDAPGVPGSEPRPGESVPEADVQRAVLALLKQHPAVAWAERINAAAGRLAYDDGKQSRFMRFAFKGCSDIVGMLRDGRFLAVECKTLTGRLTPEQAAFLATVNHHNGVAFVARSVDDVIKHLERRTP